MVTIRNDFLFPKIFLEMDKLGWLDSNNFTSLNNCDTQKYIWLYDMEWLTCDKIMNYEYESNLIIPFAHTAGGDKWAWYLDDMSKLPVVFCPHDDDEGIFYAPNIEGAMFRQILEFASQNNFYSENGQPWEMSILEAKKHLINWKKRFDKWFKKEWIYELDKLINSDLNYYEHNYGGYYVLITPDEAKDKIEKYLSFSFLNKSFIWTS
jgi:hypothetical protein